MGLDMWLAKRGKTSKEDEGREICYWRKANAILNWFDHNLESVKQQEYPKEMEILDREGVRSCTPYRVEKEELEKLLSDCKKLLNGERTADSIPEDLQRVSGFFFGSIEIDDWYWEDIQDTVKMLEKELPEIDWDNDIVEFLISY